MNQQIERASFHTSPRSLISIFGHAIDLCYKAAKARDYHIFALQNGGWCAGMEGSIRYQKYGKSSNCKNGRGGLWANDVYQVGGKFLIKRGSHFQLQNTIIWINSSHIQLVQGHILQVNNTGKCL